MSLLSRLAVQAARAYGILSSNPNNVPASYLVVAGGGGGGSTAGGRAGGGGGAGGYLTSTATLSLLTTYTVTVGAGGASVTSGANSSLAGTGLTTVTSTGGGGGGYSSSLNGLAGGSGGGGSADGTGGTATASPTQGNNGGAGGPASSNYTGGGGGGAGAVGGAGASTVAGNGGAGTASSISGSSITYAGGGGGGSYNGGTAGTGGTGGGGNGFAGNGAGAAGTVNLGAGGGGAGSSGGSYAGGAGGSGIVIISYTSATPKFVGGTLTTSGGNQIHTFTSSGTLSPLTPVTASYLVVAGGGGGGSSFAGGGGAGGFLTSSTTIYSGATYVVTVGAGGAGGGDPTRATGSNGTNSSLSGTGLTTVTSTGGGGGGDQSGTSRNGQAGGSGGGGAGNNGTASTGGTATSGQGYAGGAGAAIPSAPYYGGGGGGGASAVGGIGTGLIGGAGGAGTASSISGTSITYAGGGGGGLYTGGTGGAGGSGGGGAGGSASPYIGGSGTANLGGGGGGGGHNGTNFGGGSGGSGVVIISYAGSQVFNGGLVTSSGGNTIHTFNATGALTPLTNNLNNSLRFRSSASAYLSRTPTLATNRSTWTWSAWVKLGNVTTRQEFFSAGSTPNSVFYDDLQGFGMDGVFNATRTQRYTSAKYRDPSAWYHIVAVLDTTQATAADRMRMYVNGNQVALDVVGTGSYPAQNSTQEINNNVVHNIGRRSAVPDAYMDSYMADINFIDGQALEPYYFGNNDAYGNWKPILYKGTYGTNGFYLTFADTSALTTSSNAGLGKDTSGNGNYWTTNNISITAGVTYDAMTDVPTNTSATVANYCVMNPLNTASNQAISFANLRIIESAGSALTRAYSNFELPSSKIYFEATMTTASSTSMVGVGTSGNLSNYPGQDANSWSYHSSGGIYNNAVATTVTAATTAGDIVGIAVDMSAGKIWFSVNNTYVASGNPSTGTNPAYSGLTGSLFPIVRAYTSTIDINFGQRPFSYTPPTGYVALNTYNLPTPTILQGNKYMDATLYTGTSSAQTIVNAALFKPDLVWGKARSTTRFNVLVDSVRGSSKDLYSNSTAVEYTDANVISSINSNGFSLGTDAELNLSANTFVAWQWQAGQGSTSSNTSGSITSTVSVNTTAGFSVVTYTGNGTNGATIGHGLGVVPKWVIVKSRSSANDWAVYHSSLAASNMVFLNSTGAAQAITFYDNGGVSSTSSTTFTIAQGGVSQNNVNGNTQTYVAYCWAEIAGFSAFGSYTGNGSADGPFVYTGFRPKWILVKQASSAGNAWQLLDSSRNTYNKADNALFPNTSGAETTGNATFDFLSNGFKVRTTDGTVNTSSSTYIYMAFAENPFKNANAR